MGTLLQDIRYAWRTLSKAPVFTCIAVATLALGIGANTAIFSLTDQVLLRELPVQNPGQLVILRSPGPHPGHLWSDGDDAAFFSYPLYKDIREQAPIFSGVLARFEVQLSVSGLGQTERARGELVSGNYFDVLGVRPALGRVLSTGDETAPGANPVAVLSYGYWSRQFGKDPSVLNKIFNANGTPLTIVGVSQEGFSGVQLGQIPDVFIPVTMKAQVFPAYDTLADRSGHWLALIGRLKPGLTIPRAEAEVEPSYAAMLVNDLQAQKLSQKTAKEYAQKKLLLQPGAHGRQTLQNDVRAPLLSLMAMVLLVLLIACANLASLLVAQGEARQKETAVRLALGAGRWRLLRQFLTESLLLAGAGGVCGVLVAAWTLKALVGSIPGTEGMSHLQTSLDGRVLAFAVALTLVTSVVFGLAPGIRATRISLEKILRDQSANASAGPSSVRLRQWLVASQVALTVVLLAGAAFFAESLMNLSHARLGVRADRLVQFSIDPADSGYTVDQSRSLDERLRDGIAGLPGVQSASIAEIPVFQDDDSSGNFTIEGYPVKPDDEINIYRNYVGPDFFSTMGIPLMAGREFQASDTPTSPQVAIINQETARMYFAGRNPIGFHLAHGAGSDVHPGIEIVGVVADSKQSGVRDIARPYVFFPYTQDSRLREATFYVRTAQNPSSLIAVLKSKVGQYDSALPVFDAKSLTEQVEESVYADRLLMFFSVTLAGLAALLSAMGLYGVLALFTLRRTREIGIRVALGATRKDVSWLVAREALRVCGGGLIAGLAAAYFTGRVIESQLYGVKAGTVSVYVLAAVLLALAAWLASWLPARRAARVDPMVALRYE